MENRKEDRRYKEQKRGIRKGRGKRERIGRTGEGEGNHDAKFDIVLLCDREVRPC